MISALFNLYSTIFKLIHCNDIIMTNVIEIYILLYLN